VAEVEPLGHAKPERHVPVTLVSPLDAQKEPGVHLVGAESPVTAQKVPAGHVVAADAEELQKLAIGHAVSADEPAGQYAPAKQAVCVADDDPDGQKKEAEHLPAPVAIVEPAGQ
jgi:hypothetical protein